MGRWPYHLFTENPVANILKSLCIQTNFKADFKIVLSGQAVPYSMTEKEWVPNEDKCYALIRK